MWVILLGAYENRAAFDLLEHFHDYCLVRTLEVQESSTSGGDFGELADRLRRILLPGARESHRVRAIFRVSIENDPGSDHALRVRGFRLDVSGRKPAMESRVVISLFGGRSDVCVLGKIVKRTGSRAEQMERCQRVYGRTIADFANVHILVGAMRN